MNGALHLPLAYLHAGAQGQLYRLRSVERMLWLPSYSPVPAMLDGGCVHASELCIQCGGRDSLSQSDRHSAYVPPHP